MKDMKRIPLHDLHYENGAKIVEFFGWQMPIQYSSIVKEHNAVRENVGILMFLIWGNFYLQEKMHMTL